MRNPNWALIALAFAVLAQPAAAGPGDLGSALALPYFTGDEPVRTTIKVSNTSSTDDYWAKLLFIDGEGTGGWRGTDFDCPLIGNSSMVVELTASGTADTRIETVCGEAMFTYVLPGQRGLLWVALEEGDRTTVSADILTGSAVVTNELEGTTYALEAAAFAKGTGPNDGDHDYELDGIEYERPPATLSATVRSESSDVRTRAIFAVVDGRVNIPQPARIDLIVFDRDRTPYSASYSFDCLANVLMTDVSPLFNEFLLGPIGHVQFSSQPRSSDGKRVGIVGWLVEEVRAGGSVEPGGPTMPPGGRAASGRAMRWTGGAFVGNPVLEGF